MVAYSLAVDGQFEIPKATDISAGLADASLQFEGAAEQGSNRDVRIGRAGEPLRLPVAWLQQTHLPSGRVALADLALLVPSINLPETLLP